MANKVYSAAFENRYMNPKVEGELIDFKKEIEEKFTFSSINKRYRFKRTQDGHHKKGDGSDLKPSSTFVHTDYMKKFN